MNSLSCKSAFLIILFLVLGLGAAPAAAQIINGSHNFGQSTTININNVSSGRYAGITVSSSSEVVTSDAGVVITINVGANTNKLYAIYAQSSGSVSLGKVVVNSSNQGLFAITNASITIGDDSAITSSGGALYAQNATIKVGDRANLTSSIADGGVATVSAAGGQITIGDYAKIINNGTGSNPHMAVIAGSTTVGAGPDSKVVIGDHAVIQTLGNRNYSHAVVAGSTLANGQGGTGTVMIGAAAQISTTSTWSHGLISINDGSLIQLGADGNIEVKGNNAKGVLAQNGGQVELSSGNTINATGASAYGLYAYIDEGQLSASQIIAGDNTKITTAGTNGFGVVATSSSIVLGAGSSVETKESSAIAIYADTDSLITTGNGTEVVTGGQAAYGVYARYGGKAEMGQQNTINTKGQTAYGVLAWESGVVELGQGSSINTTGPTAYGVFAWNGGKVELGQGNIVNTTGEKAYGLYAYSKDANNVSAITAGDNLSVTTKNDGADAVIANLGAKVTIGDSVVITTHGDNAKGLWTTREGSTIIIGARASLQTTGASSHGVLAQHEGLVELGGGGHIQTAGAGSHGVSALTGGSVHLGRGNSVNTSGEKTYGLYAYSKNDNNTFSAITADDGVNVTTQSNGAAAVVANLGGKVIIGDSATIITNGDDASGLWATSAASEIILGAGARLQTAGADSHGVLAENAGRVALGSGSQIQTTGAGAYGIAARQGGVVDLVGDQSIWVDMEKGRYALFARGDSDTVVSKVSGSGIYNVLGGIWAAEYSQIDLTMQADSVFQGFTRVADDTSSLSLHLAGARWRVTEDSELTNLILNDSVVDFSDSPLETVIKVDKIEKVDQDTVFIMKADVVNERADRIILADSHNAAAHKIFVKNQGGAATTGFEVTTLVETTTLCDEVSFHLTDAVPYGRAVLPASLAIVEIGGFQYVLGKNGTEWQLYSVGAVVKPPEGIDGADGNTGGDVNVDPDDRVITSTADAAVNTFAGAYLLNYAETQSLLQRLGDLRHNPGSLGLWVKGNGGKFNSSGSKFLRGFKMHYYGLQSGLDYKLKNDWQGELYLGGFFSYSRGDQDYRAGSGNVDKKTFGLYGTYTHANGFYVDAVIKYGWMDNDFKVKDSQGQQVVGESYNTDGAGFSLEAGKRFHIWQNEYTPQTGAEQQSIYLEPQVQLSYQHQSGGGFRASNDLKVDIGSFDSTIARVGANVGYDVANGDLRANFYVKASFVREFNGDLNFKLNGTRLKESFKDNWATYGVGATVQYQEKHNLYVDFERAEGGQFTQPWSVNGGYRLTF